MAYNISNAVIKRLPAYYRYLKEMEERGETQISSDELGKIMGLTASQIRQDINSFGGFGRQGYGYEISVLKQHIGDILGLYSNYKMIVIGAGNIGHAVASYGDFIREGFEVIGAFDTDEDKIGTKIKNMTVQPLEELDEFLSRKKVDIAILAVPGDVAQNLADNLIEKNIKGIWNFAPIDLVESSGTQTVNVHLSDSLQVLSFMITNAK